MRRAFLLALPGLLMDAADWARLRPALGDLGVACLCERVMVIGRGEGGEGRAECESKWVTWRL